MNRLIPFLTSCAAFGLSIILAPAQVSSISGISATAAPLCSTAFPIHFTSHSNAAPAVSFTITISDGINTVNPAGPVTASFNSIDTTWDLTGLIAGSGTVTISDTFTTRTFPLTLYNCAPTLGLKIVLYAPNNKIAANPASSAGTPFVVTVYNDDIVSIPMTTVHLSGIPAADGTVTTLPPSPAPGTVAATADGWTWTPSGGSLNPGDVLNFPFTVKGTVGGAGNTLTMATGFTPATSPYTASDSKLISVTSSLDPNAKGGPTGIGVRHYIAGDNAVPYQIEFENDPGASAPAQEVTVVDLLDPARVDLSTFRFGPITFGNQVVAPPIGQNPFSLTVPYDIDGNPLTTADNVNVQIDGSLDTDNNSPAYGTITWTFQTLDPNTSLPPAATIGFLPADTANNVGVGTVAFNVWPQSSLVTDDAITNNATITFDLNPPITTGTWTNNILKIKPSLDIEWSAGQVQLTWPSWTLQQANSPLGPWCDSVVQVSPWTFTPSGPAKFFRLRSP
jgi:hypothetical protein